MAATPVQAAYAALQVELDDTKYDIQTLGRALQPSSLQDLQLKELVLSTGHDMSKVLEKNLHAANATVKHLGLELLLRDQYISELQQQMLAEAPGQNTMDKSMGHSSTTNSERTARMQMHCANLSARCEALEGVFHRLHHQSLSKHPASDSLPSRSASSAQREYQVTVTSPTKGSAADMGGAPIRSGSNSSASAAQNLAPAASVQGSKRAKDAPGRRSSNADAGSGEWRIAAQADAPPQPVERQPSTIALDSSAAGAAYTAAQDAELQQNQDPSSVSGQLAAAVHQISELEDHLEESQGQCATLMQQIPSLQLQHDSITSLHATLERHVVEASKLQAQLADTQHELENCQSACNRALGQLTAEQAGLVQSSEHVQQLEAALEKSEAQIEKLSKSQAGKQAAQASLAQSREQQLAEMRLQQQQAAAEGRQELGSVRAAAQRALQILTSMCEAGVNDSLSTRRSSGDVDHSNNDLPALLDMVVSFACEASTYMQQLSWQAHMRRDDLEKKLARYASVEAKAAGMEEDMSAVLADVSQLHSQLLAAEHANTDLLARRTSEQGSTRERDLLENIMRLEHQLKASGASIEEMEGQLAESESARKVLEHAAQEAEAAMQDQRGQTRRQTSRLAEARAELDKAHAGYRELETHLRQVQQSSTNSQEVLQMREALATATQWGTHLEMQAADLQSEVHQLQQTLLERAHELQAARQELDDGASAEVALLREQLATSQQSVGQLQSSLRARGIVAKISSPTIAAAFRDEHQSAGEVLRGVAHSIQDCIREQSSELVGYESQAASYGDPTDSDAESVPDNATSPSRSHHSPAKSHHSAARSSHSHHSIQLSLSRPRSVQRHYASNSELSELSDVESRPGSAGSLQKHSEDMSLHLSGSQPSLTFSTPSLVNPLYAVDSPQHGSHARPDDAQQQNNMHRQSTATGGLPEPGADVEHPANFSGQISEEASSISTIPSRHVTIEADLRTSAISPVKESSHDEQASDKGGSSVQVRSLNGEEQAEGAWSPRESGASVMCSAANPLFGAHSTSMFQSHDWDFIMRQQQEGDAFRPLGCPPNPLFGRQSEVDLTGECSYNESTEQQESVSRSQQSRAASPSRTTPKLQWSEIVDDDSSVTSSPMHASQRGDGLPSGRGAGAPATSGPAAAAQSGITEQDAVHVEAELEALQAQYQEVQQSCSAMQAAVHALGEERDAAKRQCAQLLQRSAAQEVEAGTAAASLAAAKRHCQTLESELQALQEFYGHADEDKRILQQRCARLEEALAQVNEPLNTATQEVEALLLRCQQLDAALEEAELQMADASTVGDSMQQRFVIAEQELADAHAKIESLQAVLAKSGQASDGAEEALSRVSQLERDLAQTQGERERARGELQRVQTAAKNAHDQLQQLQQSKLSASHEHAAVLNTLTERLQATEAHAHDLTAQLQAAKENEHELLARVEATNIDAEQLREVAQKAHSQKQAINSQLQEAHSELEALSSLLEQSLAEKQHLEQALPRCNSDDQNMDFAAEVGRGHRELQDLHQHVSTAFEERAAAQSRLQEEQAACAQSQQQLAESQAEAQGLGQQVQLLGSMHAQVTEQLSKADSQVAEVTEDLLAAQEQIQELSDQLQAAIREIQDRQLELRRVTEQAGSLADELAQSQHQAELEEVHAQELQSEAISGKIHLMQEVERLRQELQAMAQNAEAVAQHPQGQQEPWELSEPCRECRHLRAELQDTVRRADLAEHQLRNQQEAQAPLDSENTVSSSPLAAELEQVQADNSYLNTQLQEATRRAEQAEYQLHARHSQLQRPSRSQPSYSGEQQLDMLPGAAQQPQASIRSHESATAEPVRPGTATSIALLEQLAGDDVTMGDGDDGTEGDGYVKEEQLSGQMPPAPVTSLESKMPSLTKRLSSSHSTASAWGQGLLHDAIEAADDVALLHVLDKRCSDLVAQKERDDAEISELNLRTQELQHDLDACLEALEQENPDLSVGALAQHEAVPDAKVPSRVTGSKASSISHSAQTETQHAESAAAGSSPADHGSATADNANLEPHHQGPESAGAADAAAAAAMQVKAGQLQRTSLASLPDEQSGRLSSLPSSNSAHISVGTVPKSSTSIIDNDDREKLHVLVTRLQAQLQGRDAKIRSLQSELSSMGNEDSPASSTISNTPSSLAHRSSGLSVQLKPRKASLSAPRLAPSTLRKTQTASSQELSTLAARRTGPASKQLPEATNQQDALRARAEAAEARASGLHTELRSVVGQLQAVQKAAGKQISGLQSELETEQTNAQTALQQSREQGRLLQLQYRHLPVPKSTESSDDASGQHLPASRYSVAVSSSSSSSSSLLPRLSLQPSGITPKLKKLNIIGGAEPKQAGPGRTQSLPLGQQGRGPAGRSPATATTSKLPSQMSAGTSLRLQSTSTVPRNVAKAPVASSKYHRHNMSPSRTDSS